MANENTNGRKSFSAPLEVRINNYSRYSDKYIEVQYVIYGHDITFTALMKKEVADNCFGEDGKNLEPGTKFKVFSNGPFINWIQRALDW